MNDQNRPEATPDSISDPVGEPRNALGDLDGGGGDRVDPTALPLFSAKSAEPAEPAELAELAETLEPDMTGGVNGATIRPGRVRGTFTMHRTPGQAAPTPEPANHVRRLPNDVDHGPRTHRPIFNVHPHNGAQIAATGPRVGSTDLSALSELSGELDWSVVATFRARASDQLTAALGTDRGRMGRIEQEQLGRAIIVELLEAAAADSVSEGSEPWSLAEQEAMARAVFNALFKLGRLQPLVDDDRVENIIISGYDNVLLELVDGTLTPGPAVADSDQELVDFLVFLASRSEVNARPFSEAQPRLHLRLDGGARLAAAAWVTPRPSVVIRRHRLMQITLADLVDRGALTPVAASFLRAAVRARKSIVVAGAQGSGKTTMVRALCGEIGRWESIGTFETEYELHLHELREQHQIVHAWESRPGSGERGPDGKQAGEFTLDEALYDSFRFNLSRQIVGEVRGKEIWAMIKAMESGAGSISTTHAANAEAAIRKLVTCAMEAGSHVTQELATSKLAETVNLIVQLHLETTPNTDGTARRDRWVTEIIAISPGEREKGYATTHVFRPVRGRPAVAGILPDEYRQLEAHGFDLGEYLTEGRLEEAES